MADKKTKNEIIAGLKGELNAIEKEIKHDIVGPVIASFGFIIALVWRDAIKATLDEYLSRAGLLNEAYLYQFISAIIVTIIVIVIMVWVSRWGQAKKTKKIVKAIEKKIEEVSGKK